MGVDLLLWTTLGINGPERRLRTARVGVRKSPFARHLLSISTSGRQDMDCPICGAVAERTVTTIDSVTIACPVYGKFDVASSVIASGQLQGLAVERADVLGRARHSAEPGGMPYDHTL